MDSRPSAPEPRIDISQLQSLSPRLLILNSFALILSLISIFIFTIGSYDYVRNFEKNKCEMTYMFEFPQYVKISLSNENDNRYPMYGLYAYTEGKQIEAVRQNKFTGIPVLFLPGNAGSYKQVRSFASVALRKYLNSRTPFHFDFFSLDFNEEISGIYGYVLKRQSEYTRQAIKRIMSFYEDFHHVVLIGHSMGGLIAKTLNDEEAQVQMMYTFATPHLQPLIIADPEIDLFYYHLNKNWTRMNKENSNSLTLVSVAGGDRDLLIPNKLTRSIYTALHTSTSSMPTVWASTDHLCIVWCKQVVMSVVRSLFDMVELKTKFEYYAISQNITLREQVLNYHLMQRTSGKSYHSAHPDEVEGAKPPSAHWTEYLARDYCQPASNKLTFVMFPIKIFEKSAEEDSKNTQVLVTTSNTKPKNWIFGCKSQTFVNNIRICSKLVNLSNQTRLIPSFHRRRKVVHLDYPSVSEYSHLIVKLDPSPFPSCVNTEAYNNRERSKVLGDIFTSENKMFYRFSFPLPYNISRLFAWRLSAKLQRNDMTNSFKCDGHHNSVGIFRHGDYQTHNFFKNESVLIRFSDWTAKAGDVELYLEKSCKYILSYELAWVETAGQIFRTYKHLLPSYITGIILMSLAFQPQSGWSNFPRILLRNAYYLTIIPGFIVSFSLIFIPNDYPLMMDAEEYTVLVAFALFLIAFATVFAIGISAYIVIVTVGNTYHSLIMRFLTRKLGSVPEKVTELALNYTFDKFPITVAVAIIAIALTTCGALGLGVGLFFFLVKIFKSYQDILEDIVRQNLKPGEIFSSSNFQFHCGMLWLIVTLLNLPGLIYWIHNYSFDEAPQWDLSLYLCLMLTPALAILWQGFVPDFNSRLWKLQRCMCYLTGVAAVIWGTFRLYLLSFLIVIVILSLAGCQMISLMAPTDNADMSQRNVSTSGSNNKPELSKEAANDVSNSSEDAMTAEDSMSETESE